MKIADLFVDLKLDTTAFDRQLATTLRRASSQSVTVGVDVDTRSLDHSLSSALRRASGQKVTIGVDADTSAAMAKLSRLTGKTVTINTDADTRSASTKIDVAARDRDAKINVHADSATLASATQNMNALTTAAVALGPALAPLAALSVGGIIALAPALGAAASAAGVAMLAFHGIGGALTALGNQHASAAKDAASHAAAEQSAASAVASAQSAMVAARRSAARGSTDAAAAVRAAQQGVGQAEQESARAAAQAAQQVVTARQGVASATQSAAAGVQSALASQASAEQGLQRAQEQAKIAQDDLTKARADAARQLEEYRLQVSGASIDQKQAQLDLVKAKLELDKTMADPKATEIQRQQAQLTYQEQLQRLNEVAQRKKEIDQDASKAQRRGVEGSDQVQAAKRAKQAADQSVRDARKQVSDAIKAVAKAQADGARQIAAAQAQVAAALRSQADTEVQNQQRVKAARDNVAKAKQAQDRQAIDSSANVANAQRSLNDALSRQKDVQSQVSSSVEATNKAMEGLSPAGQKFVLFLDSLRGKFTPLIAAAQTGLFGGLTKGIQAALPALQPMIPAVQAISKALGDAAYQAGQFIGGPFGTKFINLMGQIAPKLIGSTATILENFAKIFINMAVAGAPLILKLTDALVGLTDHLAAMSGQKGAFDPFINFVTKYGPLIWQTLTDIGAAFAHIVVAAIPIGVVVLQVVDGISKAISAIPLPVLTAIIGAIAALAVSVYAVNAAVRGVTAIMNAWKAITTAVTIVQAALNAVMDANPIALVVLAIAGLVAAFVLLFKHNKAFHDAVIVTWNAIKTAIVGAWNNYIKPALNAIWSFIKNTLVPIMLWLWHNVVIPAFHAIADVVKWAWDKVISPVLHAYWWYISKVLAPVISWLWHNVVEPVFKGLAAAIKWYWDHVVHPVFDAIVYVIKKVIAPAIGWLWHNVIEPAWKGIGSAIKYAWDHVINPVFGALKSGLGKVKDAFSAVKTWISDKWGEIQDAAKTPIEFVVNTVIRDGILPAVRKIPGLGGLAKDFKGVKFASGGVMPGYTPGRDVHNFYSPTGGALSLSGGEAIMRPEWTRAIGGKSAVDQINKMAAQNKFASGGLFRPVHGGRLVQGIHDTSTGFPAIDIGVPVGTPVYAGHSGRVSVSKDLRGYEPRISHQNGYRSYGKYIQIAGSGMSTLYAHLSRRSKGVGTNVAGGQPIGLSGLTGHTYGPHLHFGARGVSPLSFLGGKSGSGTPGAGVPAGTSSGVDALQGNQASALSGIHPKEWIDTLKKMGGWGGALGGAVTSLVDTGKNYIKDKFSALISKAKDLAAKVGHGIGNFFGHLNPWHGDSGHLDPGTAQSAAKNMLPSGWSWPALQNLWNGESGWRWNALNRSSGAYGIPQSLPASKMASAGGDWHDNAVTQIKWGLNYIRGAYGNSQNAWSKWLGRSPHWYARGGKVMGPGTGTSDSVLARVSTGEYIVPAHAVPENEDLLNTISGFARGGKVSNKAQAAAKARAIRTVEAVKGLVNAFKTSLDRTKFAAGMKSMVAHITNPRRRRELASLTARLSSRGGTLTRIRTAQANLTSLQAQRGEFVSGLHDTIAPNIADYAHTPGGILQGLRDKVAAVGRFKTGLANLAKDGYPRALILQVAGLGLVDGAAAAAQLHGLNAKDRGEVTKLFNQLNKDSGPTGIAGQIGDAVYGPAIAAAKKSLQALPKDKDVIAAMNALGEQIVNGFRKVLNLPVSKPKPKATHDAGGWLARGRSLVVNNTGKPEAVLNNAQWSQVDRLIAAVQQGQQGGSRAPLIGHADIHSTVDLEKYERQRAFRDRSTRM